MDKWLILGLITLMAGCSSELESGYKPKKLGVSDAERRAYYASPFSPEAQAGQQEQQQEMNMRRPGPGF